MMVTNAGTINGTIFWGVETALNGGAGLGAGYLAQSSDLDYSSEAAQVRNKIGNTVGKYFYDDRKQVQIEVIPASSSALPKPGTTCVIADSDDSDYNGTYSLVSSNKKKSNTEAVRYSFTLERYIDGGTPKQS